MRQETSVLIDALKHIKMYAGREHIMIDINKAEDRIDDYFIDLENIIKGEVADK